jgi:hypothetical protein
VAKELRQDVLQPAAAPAGVQALVLDLAAEFLVGDTGEVFGPGAVDGVQQFGAAVAEALAAHGGAFKVAQMFVRRIPKSGRTPDDVLRFVGLSTDDIVRAAAELC